MKDSLKNCCGVCKGSKYWSDDSGCLHGCHTTTEKKCKHLTIITAGGLIGCDDCKMGDAQLRKELSTTDTSDWSKHIGSSTLAGVGVVDTSDNWQERFDELIRHLTGATLDTPLISNASALQTFIAKEKERSYDQGHCDGHDVGLTDGMAAGKEVMLASVREKVAGMKKEIPEHECNSTAYCTHYPISDIKNDALQDLLNTLSTLEK